MSRFFLTTAIDYVNSRPHLGTAYEKIAADVIARYKRLCGFETHFLMGNDEHSQNVYRSAKEQGLSPLEYCDRMEQEFTRTWRHLDVSFDDFIRTTEARHRTGVTEIVRRIHAAGDIYEGSYEGWYCEGCEAFKQEKDLVDGHCPLHPTTQLQWIKEKNHFFRLSKYQRALADHHAAHPEFLQPEGRRNEILRLIEGGLEDISVSRAGQSWGIPLPFDPTSVVYVWFDALVNYASAVGLGADQARFEKWWPADLHVIGKDITRFHTVIWPAMLMSAKLPLPRQVFGHGFMTMSGQRMSKSLGTIVDPIEAASRHGVDPLRLYLVKEIAFGGDGDFSWERFDERYNVDLANNLGNLVSRIAAMAEKYRDARLSPAGTPGRLAEIARTAVANYRASMDVYALEGGAAAAFHLVDAANEYIAATEPWALARDASRARELSQVLYDLAEAVRIAAILLLPIMPRSASEILRRVGETKDSIRLSDAEWRNEGDRLIVKGEGMWPRSEQATSDKGQATSDKGQATSDKGQATSDKRQAAGDKRQATGGPPSPRAVGARGFGEAGRPERPQRSTRVDEVKNPAPPTPAAPPPAAPPAPSAAAADSKITIDDFMKIDLRTAKVLTAEKVPNSRKLIKLTIDAGTEQRTLVAGIADGYEPETLVGRTIVMVFNLKPAKLMGIESNGMVLAASPEGGKPTLVGFDQEVPPGTRVR